MKLAKLYDRIKVNCCVSLFLLILNFSFAQNSGLKIIEKPINYSAERIALSLEYLKDHHGLVQKNPTIVPKMIVLHYTAGGTVESNFKYFNKTHLESARNTLKKQSISIGLRKDMSLFLKYK